MEALFSTMDGNFDLQSPSNDNYAVFSSESDAAIRSLTEELFSDPELAPVLNAAVNELENCPSNVENVPLQEIKEEPNSPPEAHTSSCHICGKPCGKHNFYGAQSCHGCRSFFRRSAQQGKYPGFICLRPSKCEDDICACQRCRFDQCVKAGMDIALVSSKEAKSKLLRSKQSLLGPGCMKPSELVTLEQKIYLKSYYDRGIEHAIESVLTLMQSDWTCVSQVVKYLHTGGPITTQTLGQLQSCVNKTNFYGQMDDMRFLCDHDQRVLLKENVPAVYQYLSSVPSTSIEERNQHLGLVVKRVFAEDKKLPSSGGEDLEPLRRSFEACSITPKKFSTWSNLPSHEMVLFESPRLKELDSQMGKWSLGDNNSSRTSDPIQVMLALLMILFSSDGLVLRQREKVDGLQSKYALMLHRYLKEKYRGRPAAVTAGKLRGAVFMASLAKEAVEIKERMTSKE